VDLTIDTVVDGNTTIVACHGHIIHGTTARRFGARVGRLISRHRRIVLDLGGVTSMDARGLGILAALIRQAGGWHGQLVLAAVSDRVGHLLRLTRIDTQVRRLPLETFDPGSDQTAYADRLDLPNAKL
jgi:anti-anti-sigma factor